MCVSILLPTAAPWKAIFESWETLENRVVWHIDKTFSVWEIHPSGAILPFPPYSLKPLNPQEGLLQGLGGEV